MSPARPRAARAHEAMMLAPSARNERGTKKGRQAMRRTSMLLSVFGAALLAVACGESQPNNNLGSTSSSGEGGSGNSGTGNSGTGNSQSGNGGAGGSEAPPEKTILDERVVDYNEALRTASLKLLRRLPTLAEIKAVAEASDPKAAYESALDAMIDSPEFAARMVKYWKDTMRQGGGARETAPVHAARIMVEERSFKELFTSPNNNCPTFDGATGAFADGECNNGAPQEAGVLTNPGVMSQYYGNMAFRRVRWVQEIFLCTRFPAEYSGTPIDKGGNDYTSPWVFESIATAPIDFQDTSSVICANCHTTMNHVAPLFAHFDEGGNWVDGLNGVNTPTAPDPTPTSLEHYLAPGEQLSWRLGTPTPDFASLGQAIAEDPAVTECAVARMWNFAMSKEDIVSDLSTVPREVIDPFITEFEANNYNLKATLRSIMKGEDFVKF
jgi:hypothetical protein